MGWICAEFPKEGSNGTHTPSSASSDFNPHSSLGLVNPVKDKRIVAAELDPDFSPSQWVWLSTRDLRLHRPCKKLNPRYVGPFKILRQITPVSYRLVLPANYRISPTFHVSLLKPAGGPRGERNLEGAEVESTPPIIVDGEEAYQVREILDSRRRGGVLQYLIDWEGYGPEEHSWIKSQDILDPNLTNEFHQQPPWQTSSKDPVEDLGVRIVLASGAARRGGGSVTSQASVALSDRHQRAPSPEYYLFTNSISHYPRT